MQLIDSPQNVMRKMANVDKMRKIRGIVDVRPKRSHVKSKMKT